MGIKPIKKVNVSEQVFEQLKELLIKGEWRQGEKLPSENELAEMFHVSRITVRQALQKLNVLGLIETRLGEGSFVREIDPSDTMNALIPTVFLSQDKIVQVLEFRDIIEVESAKLAAQRATDEDILKLKKILEKMKASQGKRDAFSKADLDFHERIGSMTKNDLLMKTYGILRGTLQAAMDDVITKVGYESGIFYHEKLIECMEKHDGKEAVKVMKEHLSRNKNYYGQEQKEEI